PTGQPPRSVLHVEQVEDRSLPSGSALLDAASGGSLLPVDPVLLWNNVALAVHVIDHTPGILPGSGLLVQGGPTRTARALGMVQGAVFDAVNSIDRSYTPYLLTQTFGSFASKPAAVAVAAHDTLAALYPQQRGMLDIALQLYLLTIPNGAAENEGVRAGHAAASAMLAARANDGSGAPMSYTPGNKPGDHRPDPLNPNQGFLTPQWGDVTPFTMNSGGGTDAFLSPAPPELTSPAYAAAFNEVKVVGAADAETADRDHNGLPDRTPEQTMIGIYWAYDGSRGLGTPPRLYNQIAQTIAVQQHNTLVQNARMFALVNIAMADAGIQAWDTKYEFNFWRPILAVREADPGTGPTGLGDGNPATQGEAGWTPLGASNTNAPPGSINFTPNFPAYTSGHATFGATLFQTLTRFYGRDDITFTFVSDEFNGRNRDVNGQIRPLIPRTFTSFSQAAEENGQSRIYLGIHWAFDKTNGIAAGNRIANFVFDNFLRPRSGATGFAAPTALTVAAPTGGGESSTTLTSASLAPAPGTPPASPSAAAPVGNDLAPQSPNWSFAPPEPTDPLAIGGPEP
ncbi:MAG TPA: phosphatase PAP2 family protein, partial [Gemmataceae bacterium]|nr:phosphatase PAP2 family protein [Gemmataceae bacterium]